MSRIELDDRGYPISLADDAKAKPPEPAQEPQETWRSGQWDRRADAVRDFAREFETLSVQDIRELVRARTNRELTDVEVIQFLTEVRDQQLADLADILDQRERGPLRRRRHVRVVAPNGYVRKTMHALTDGELTRLEDRLRGRGWTDEQVQRGLIGKLSAKRQAARANPALATSTPSR